MDLHNQGCKKRGLEDGFRGHRSLSNNLAVVEAVPEGDVGLQVDDDAQVEQDEAHHQVFVDSQPGTAQGAAIIMSQRFSES